MNPPEKRNRTLTPVLIFSVFALFLPLEGKTQTCKVLDPELQESYSGPCVNGLAEGDGRASGGAEYVGGFEAGRKHGFGVKTWPNGDRYEGEWAGDHREGYGSYQWGRGAWQGERYDGEYVADRRHGYGIYWWPSGDVYSGPWQADVPIGPGTEMMHARAKHDAELRAAVAKNGQKVCREMPVGIGGREWIRGVVVDIEGEHVGVRIDEPGKQGNFPRGEVVWDLARSWTPCW
jgi:MORN repeat